MLYLIPNGPMPTTASQATMDTGTALKTMLQVKLAATHIGHGKIVEWGFSLDGFAAALPGKVELLTTGAIKATIVEHVATGILPYGANATAVTDDNPFAFGAAGDETGYAATGASAGEGSIVATEMKDFVLSPPTGPFVHQFPLGREPTFDPDEYLRIRVLFGTDVNMYCYVVVEV